MALWKCTNEKCDFKKDSRCKPRKCPDCEGTVFEKAEACNDEKEGCCSSCNCK